MEEIKQNKDRKTFTLKPINIVWLAKHALELSTPENKISDSALLDEILDKAREADTSPSPTQNKKKQALRLETAIIA